MTNPIICEEMIAQPSPVEGWVQWGMVSTDGTFQGEYGLEASLNKAESLYYLAAAGVCEIKGAYQQGQPAPADIEEPQLSPESYVAVTPASVESESVQVAPGQQVSTAQMAGAVLAVAVVAAVWWHFGGKAAKARDTTPHPQSKYGDNPFGGGN